MARGGAGRERGYVRERGRRGRRPLQRRALRHHWLRVGPSLTLRVLISRRGMNPAGRGHSCRRGLMGWRMAGLEAGMRAKMMLRPAEPSFVGQVNDLAQMAQLQRRPTRRRSRDHGVVGSVEHAYPSRVRRAMKACHTP